MLLKRITFLLVVILAFASGAKAQSPTDKIDPEAYNADLMVQSVLDGLNGVRWNAGLDSMLASDILFKAGLDIADGYAADKRVTIDPELAPHLAKKYGGTNKVSEIAVEVSAGKAKSPSTYAQVASDIVDKIKKNKKFLQSLNNPKYFYLGIGSAVNAENHKCYVSIVLGGNDAFNNGAKSRKKLPVPYSKKKYGLNMGDDKECKSCEKYDRDLQKLQERVYIQDGKVWLETDDFKKFKKMFKNSGDGLAVDIVQKAQYPCNADNIFDNNLNSRGYMTKPVYQSKLIKNNLNQKDDPKTNTYKTVLGKLNKKAALKLGDGYELNLVFIIDKNICREVKRTYLDDNGENGFTPLGIYPDSITANDPNRYVPKSENQVLTFNVPFEQGKYNYNEKDIQEFINTLNEPDFKIEEINIEAHSSLEGDSLQNAQLQQQRAQSIVDALKKYTKGTTKDVVANITTNDSWEYFQQQVKGTQFEGMGKMSKAEVKAQFADANVLSSLEPILKEERFAKIELKVTLDLTGKNEQMHVYNSYKKAVQKKDYAQALRIQRWIVQQIMGKKYDAKAFLAIDVPNDKDCASLLVNKMFIDNHFNHADSIYKALYQQFDDMYKTMSANSFVNFNHMMAWVKTQDITDNKQINEYQNKITDMYSRNEIPQPENDALNMEFQFKIIEKADTLDPSVPNPTVQACMDRIKKIFNIEAETWQNALKLAVIFEKHGDLAYSMKLLEPFLTDDKVDENLLFTYISIASHFSNQIFSKNFRIAMSKAAAKNSERYCKLFGYPNMSFQVMDNPQIKKQYCDVCGGASN